jgi:CubicO group peptidase (beta-lactamase class C family)
VAARVAEVVSQTEYGQLAQRLLFGPLGMRDTGFRPDRATHDKMPTQYTRRDGALVGAWWVIKPSSPRGSPPAIV